MRETCGYTGHVCGPGVKFISRYRDENDYCVDGRRIRVCDTGRVSPNASAADVDAIFMHELERYGAYLEWRSAWRRKMGADFAEFESVSKPSPFDCGIARAVSLSRAA